MKKQSQASLGVNFIMNALLAMSSFIFPLITFPYVSRVLLAEGNGKIQMATSFVSYFLLFSQLGIPTYGIRACAAVRDDRKELSRIVHELTFINFVVMVLAYGVFFVLLECIPRLHAEYPLYLVMSTNLILALIGVEWLFKAMEQYTYITVRSLIFKVIAVVAMFLLVHEKEDYVIYAAISIVASAGSNIMNLTQLPRYIDLKPVGGYRVMRHMKPVLVFFAMSCAATIYTNLDSVMLGFMATDADVGYYAVAVKIKNILVSLVTALGAVMLPRVSYYVEHGQLDEFWKIAAKALRFVFLVAFPLAVYFMIFARESVFFLSGDGYAPAIMPMVVIMPTLLLIGLTNVTGIQVLVPMGREKAVLYSTIAGAVIDTIINALLIPTMQSTGAAIGTLIAEAVVLAVQVYYLRGEAGRLFHKLPVFKVSAAVAAASAASCWVKLLNLSGFFTLVISCVAFFSVYGLVLHVTKEPLLLDMESRVFGKIAGVLRKRKGE